MRIKNVRSHVLCNERRFGEHRETGGFRDQEHQLPACFHSDFGSAPQSAPSTQDPSSHPLLFPDVQSKVQKIAKGVEGDLMLLWG